ncbi:hypothetical protein SAMN05444380_10597 [Thermophagus xiamenensis]|uniref:Uncharacterized protein n=1 Tax=Thermophagus xiamenensis TaxID=385682 RepID=A0A1I1X0H8_9BACT|nr:hypothetical protein SAMN05444380_10597 [Thermophagus xiamenensis]
MCAIAENIFQNVMPTALIDLVILFFTIMPCLTAFKCSAKLDIKENNPRSARSPKMVSSHNAVSKFFLLMKTVEHKQNGHCQKYLSY